MEQPTRDQLKAFKEYMLSNLQSSRNFHARLEQRNQQAINFFLAMLTALGGGAIVIITSVPDQTRSQLFLGLDFLFMAGFGLLTYFWLLVSFADGMQEGFYQFFLHKYFRDLNPDAFEKYGLSTLLTWYSQAYDKNFKSTSRFANVFTMLLLVFFTGIMGTVAIYMVMSALLGKGYLLISIGAGIASLVLMGLLWWFFFKRISKFRVIVQEIIKKNHSELPEIQDVQDKNAY
jgi:hypothetical protein